MSTTPSPTVHADPLMRNVQILGFGGSIEVHADELEQLIDDLRNALHTIDDPQAIEAALGGASA